MICITVSPESRRLARVDLLNAARQADLVELCLDRFVKSPLISDLLDGMNKPVLISCRRPDQGGRWQGTEEERISLLREASLAGPAYIELDPELVRAIPLQTDTQVVCSFVSLDRPFTDLTEIMQQAERLGAHIVKLTCPTPTLDEAWPLLQQAVQQRKLPVVGMPLGHSGSTFSLLGRKWGSPWIYAALEKGMETHEGQLTVAELEEIYDWRRIGPQTNFVGVIGFGKSKQRALRVLNRAFRKYELDLHCLPLEMGRLDGLSARLDALKINAVLTTRHLGNHFLKLASQSEDAAKTAGNADLLIRRKEGWVAYNSLWRSAIRALERKLFETRPQSRPLEGTRSLVFGGGRLAHTLTYGLQQRGSTVLATALSDEGDDQVLFCEFCGTSFNTGGEAPASVSESFNIAAVPFAEVMQTPVDVVVIADPSLELGYSSRELNPAFLRPGMTVLDVTRLPEESDLIAEARMHGCRVVEPADIFDDQLGVQFKSISGKELPADVLLD